MDEYWLQIIELAPNCQIVQSLIDNQCRRCHWGFNRLLYLSEIQDWATASSLPINPKDWNEKQINQFNKRFLNDI